MSVVAYGNVVLPYAMITSFKQEAVYDDEGQVDWYLTRFDVECQAVLNYNYLPILAPDLVGETQNPAYIMAVVRNRLLKPKQRLSVQINGVELIPQNGLPGSVDADNGPKPQSCNITNLTDVTFMLTFRIVASYWELQQGSSTLSTAPQGGGIGNAVLFNRWSESIDIDNLNYTKRTREGKFVIRSDNNRGIIADIARAQMATVGVPVDFIRESSSYKIAPNGLAVMYRVTDKEQFKMPPFPAYEADGKFSVSSGSGAGAIRFAQCDLTLKGAKGTDQAVLLQAAIGIVTSKMKANGLSLFGVVTGPLKSLSIIKNFNVNVDMYKNEVTISVRAQHNLGKNPIIPQQSAASRFQGVLAFDWQAMVTTPGSEQGQVQQPLAYPAYGTAGLLLQAASYYDPAIQNQGVDPTTGNMAPPATKPGEGGVFGQ